MSNLKKAFGISAAVAICISLSACSSTSEGTNSSTSTTASEATTTTTSEATTTTTQTDILYAVFGADNVKEYPIEYTGEKKTAEELAQELSKLTGLDFNITASKTDDGWIVDWAVDSTLIAGLDNREQKEEFYFFDCDSLNWFMMDSLWQTLTTNLNAENIYYTMDGGKELTFEELYPVNEFPSDIPYMGSEFYFAHTDILYAVFGTDNVKEYPIEYTGAQKTAEELAQELSKLTGLDFNITSSKTDDGWIVDWAADSSLIAGLDNREQKEEFFFFDCDSLNWFMMDSLWQTLTTNLNAENIYYTMDGGKELTFEELYPVNEFPSDIPYMGSEFYFAHSDVRGDDENYYACTKGLWRLDGAADTASIEMDGLGGFAMYYADGAVEAVGYLECGDELNNGCLRYDMYNAEGEFIVGFYFDSDTQFHLVNEAGSVYLLDA